MSDYKSPITGLRKPKIKPVESIKPTTLNQLRVNQVETQETFKSNLGIAGCFTENIGELIVQLDNILYDEQSGKVVLQGTDFLDVLATLYGTLEDSVQECLGKELKIEFGDSAGANTTEMLLSILIKTFLEKRVK